MNKFMIKIIMLSTVFFLIGLDSLALGVDETLLVTKVKDGLYAAKAKSATGEAFYLGMEEVSNSNIYMFWRAYYQATNTTGKDILGSFAKNGIPRNKKLADNIFSSIYREVNDSRDQFDISNKLNDCNPFRLQEQQISPGLIGFKEFINAARAEEKVAYMVYAQREPVTGFAYETFKCTKIRDTHVQHLHQYKNLLMSFGVLTAKDSISVTHMGIFRNPTTFTKKFPKISVTLHGFAAYCMKNVWDPTKIFQVNRPARAMADLLRAEFSGIELAQANTPEHVELSRLDHCPVVEENPILSIELELLQTAFVKNAISQE